MTQFDPLDPFDGQKFEIYKSKMAAAAILKNRKNRQISYLK